jgi:hypothetical protein
LCVRRYLRYAVSYLHVTELVAERGVEVHASCICRWGAQATLKTVFVQIEFVMGAVKRKPVPYNAPMMAAFPDARSTGIVGTGGIESGDLSRRESGAAKKNAGLSRALGVPPRGTKVLSS